MLQMLNVPSRIVTDLMSWSQLSMTQRYQHVPDQLHHDVAAVPKTLARPVVRGLSASGDGAPSSTQPPSAARRSAKALISTSSVWAAKLRAAAVSTAVHVSPRR
jgi:hypothetical protein